MEVKKYISVVIKKEIIKDVLNKSFESVDGILKYDPLIKDIVFHTLFVDAYVEKYPFVLAEDNTYNMYDEYDKLVSTGKLNEILKECGRDYDVFLDAVNCAVGAKLKENSVEFILAKFCSQLLEKLDKYLSPKSIKKLVDSINKLNPDILKVVK